MAETKLRSEVTGLTLVGKTEAQIRFDMRFYEAMAAGKGEERKTVLEGLQQSNPAEYQRTLGEILKQAKETIDVGRVVGISLKQELVLRDKTQNLLLGVPGIDNIKRKDEWEVSAERDALGLPQGGSVLMDTKRCSQPVETELVASFLTSVLPELGER